MQQRVMARLTTETANAEEIEKVRQRRFNILHPVKAEEEQPNRSILNYSIVVASIIILVAISLVIFWRRPRKSE
jgi:heme/copper-type cytochrome/quinol oxidase subunit 2